MVNPLYQLLYCMMLFGLNLNFLKFHIHILILHRRMIKLANGTIVRFYWIKYTDNEHTMAKSLILCGPNSNLNPKWDLDIKAFCRTNGWLMENMDKGLNTKMTADKSAKNIPNAPKFICLNCLPKSKSFGFFCKKSSLGVRSPW